MKKVGAVCISLDYVLLVFFFFIIFIYVGYCEGEKNEVINPTLEIYNHSQLNL